MTKVHVSYMFDGSVARIVLDDGKGNVLDKLMVDDLLEFLTAAKANNNLKLITFEGAGKHFSFGASVEEHRKDQAAGMLQGFHKIFYELIDLAIPTVAIVSGQCLGGGLELALMCNLLIADATARLGQPEIILGVFSSACLTPACRKDWKRPCRGASDIRPNHNSRRGTTPGYA